MTKDVGILVLGLLVALVSFLGIPNSWKTVVFVLAGLGIALLAFLLRTDLTVTKRNLGKNENGVYRQNMLEGAIKTDKGDGGISPERHENQETDRTEQVH